MAKGLHIFHSFRKVYFFSFTLILFLCFNANGQTTVFSENFDGAWTSPSPAGMSSNQAAASADAWHRKDYTTNWTSGASGSPSAAGASSTSYYARYHSYWSTTTATLFNTANIDLSAATAGTTLQFYYINPTGTDKLVVKFSSNGGTSWSAAIATLGTSASWTLQTITITNTYWNSSFKFRLEATGDFGNDDIGVDQVAVIEPCSVTAGTAAGATTICSGTTAALSLSGQSGGTTLQWQESSDNVTFSNVGGGSGATTANYTTAALASTTYFRCAVLNGCTVYSNSVTVTVNAAPSITAQPSNSIICYGQNTSFSVTAAGAGLTYQWQLSTDGGSTFSNQANGGVYSNMTTATMNITGATAGMNNYRYRCVVSGSCTPSTTSNSASLTTGVCYCAVSGPGTYYITNVTFSGINNNSGYTGYTFYTSPVATVNLGCTYTLSVTENSFADYYRVWIDYDGDGTFAAGESVFNGQFGSPSPATASTSITIPGTAATGTTRMRVMHSGSGPIAATSACTNVPSWGEVEDYAVTIGTATPPSAPTSNAASAISCNSFNANWTSIAGATSYLIDVATDAAFTSILSNYNNFDVGNVVTYNLTGLASGTTYYYRVRASGCGGSSSSSGSQSATPTAGATDTYTGASGNWNVAGNWSGGIPVICSNVVIPAGKAVTIPTGYAAVCNNLNIASTASLTINGSGSLNDAGSSTIDGSITHAGTGALTLNNLTANNGSTITKTSTGTFTITNATFGATSNLIFNAGSNQFDLHWNYGNVTFNDASNAPTLASAVYPLRVQGNLTITAMAGNTVELSNGASLTHTIGGNLNMNSANTADIFILDNGSGSPVINIGGNVVFSNTAECELRLHNSTSGTPTLNIGGDLTMIGDNTSSALFTGTTNTGNANLNITGNINATGPGAVHMSNERGFCVGASPCGTATVGACTANVSGSIIVAATTGHFDLGFSPKGGNSTIYIGGSATVGAGGIFAGPHGQDKTDALYPTLIFKSPASGTVAGNLSMSKGESNGEGVASGDCRIGSGFFKVEIQANRIITLQSDIELGNNATFIVDAGGTLITGTPGVSDYIISRRSGNYGTASGTSFTLSPASGGLYSTIDATSTNAAGALQAAAYAGNIQTNNRSYSSTANYKFSAIVAQSTGNFPTVTTPTVSTVNKLIVNNTNATITTGLTLTSPVTITSDLQFLAGRLKTTTTNLPTIDVSGTSSGYGTTSANTAYVDGPLAKNSNTASTFLFPTGKSTNGSGLYRPTALTPAAATAVTYRAELSSGATTPSGYNVSNMLSPVQWVEPNFYWDIIRTSGTNVNAYVKLYYDNVDTSSTYKYTGVGQYLASKWTNEGGTLGPASPFRSTCSVAVVATIPTATGSNPFTLIASNTVLPIELLTFTAKDRNEAVDLNWVTASENNSDLFTVEKSKDGLAFTPLASLKAAGNSMSLKNYSYTDFTNENSSLYYRLREKDLDGKEQLSSIVSVTRSGIKDVLVRMNQEKNLMTIENLTESNDPFLITIVDVLGRTILSGSYSTNRNQKLEIPVKEMKTGIYFINILNNNYRLSKKFFN